MFVHATRRINNHLLIPSKKLFLPSHTHLSHHTRNSIMTNANTPKKIAVVVGSQRSPRAGLQISSWVYVTIQQANTSPSLSISLLDLQDWNLPFFDEPGVPSQITSADGYKHDHTKRWSREISSYSAFVFVTPQYNWGYPANLKNALDYLFNEWKGKPAVVISYGGHGGGKAAEQLKQVLAGLRMKVVDSTVGLTFPDRGFLVKAATGGDIGLSVTGEDAVWSKERKDIVEAFEELTKLLEEA